MTDPTTHLNAALEDRYSIERELGEGGMATVYLAEDQKHRRRVALKVLKSELAAVESRSLMLRITYGQRLLATLDEGPIRWRLYTRNTDSFFKRTSA